MIGYETEEQQVQAIKQFWKDNGVAIIAGALIGLGLLFGWRWYNDSKIESQESASSAYQTGLESLTDEESAEQLKSFLVDNPDNGYAPLAALILAQQAVDKEDYEGAKEALQKALSGDAAIADVARLRLANVHLQLGDSDAALSVLDTINSVAFNGQLEELKGDALYAKGEFDAASSAYTLALAVEPTNRNLKMKRDNIAYAKTKAIGDGVE